MIVWRCQVLCPHTFIFPSQPRERLCCLFCSVYYYLLVLHTIISAHAMELLKKSRELIYAGGNECHKVQCCDISGSFLLLFFFFFSQVHKSNLKTHLFVLFFTTPFLTTRIPIFFHLFWNLNIDVKMPIYDWIVMPSPILFLNI